MSPYWSLLTIIYYVILVLSGWRYAISRDRAIAWIHSSLMLGVAGVCGFYGFEIFNSRSYAGGHGPDANSMAGFIYDVGLILYLIAFVAAVCGLGVIIHVLRNHKNTR